MCLCLQLPTDITLITPQNSQSILETALSKNPHLAALQLPSVSVLAPLDLTLTTGTAEILCLPEIQACIKSDFVLLPCDLVCELPGKSLLEAWMMTQASVDGTTDGQSLIPGMSSLLGISGERGGRRGGIGVWYPVTDSSEEKPKDEVPDFLVTAPLSGDDAPAVRGLPYSTISIRESLQKLIYTIPMDTFKDIVEEKRAFFLRHSLLNRYERIKMLTTYRDAHLYFFPYWVKEFVKKNEKFQSISEDLVGWWAKAEWQKGLADKLGLSELFQSDKDQGGNNGSVKSGYLEEEIDLMEMSTTKCHTKEEQESDSVQSPNPSEEQQKEPSVNRPVPSILAYVNSTQSSAPLIRRVDNSALLLSTSLRLAKLEPTSESPAGNVSPYSHPAKVANPSGIAGRCTVTKPDCLLGEGVTVEEKCIIKECVIGANCHIASGARLTRCVLMDDVTVGERSQLIGCVVGQKSKIGRDSVLKDCEVQNGNKVPDETDAKNEKFMVFEGLEEDAEEGEDGNGEAGGEIDFGDGMEFDGDADKKDDAVP